jgi:hypothetical protein
MEKPTYSEKLKHPLWQKKRLEIMNRDKFTCKICGDDETELHVHHKEYIDGNDPWDYANSFLITLCSHCHLEIEKLKKEGIEKEIKIYKSIGWTDGSRIMFVTYQNICSMRIYDGNDKYVIGFDFSGKLMMKYITKAFNRAINGKKRLPESTDDFKDLING